jgi:hypothetical protein
MFQESGIEYVFSTKLDVSRKQIVPLIEASLKFRTIPTTKPLKDNSLIG